MWQLEYKVLFIWNFALVVCIAATSWTGRLAFWFPGI